MIIIYIIEVLLLSGSTQVVECDENNNTIQPANNRYSNAFKESSLVTLLMDLVETRPIHIHLLYDEFNEDKAQMMSMELSKKISGLMTFRFDPYSESFMDVILNAATKHTSFMTFCSFLIIIDVFQKMKADRARTHSVNWILVFNEEVRNESMAALQNFIFEGTRVTIVNQDTSEKVSVHSADVDKNGIMSFYYKGQWDNRDEERQAHLMTSYDPDQYMDMKGRQLYIAANHDVPYFELGEENEDGSFLAIGGIDFRIIELLGKSLNFTYKIFSPADGAWGYPQPDGTITGMIGMVARREVNFAVTGIALNVIRNNVIDYTIPYFMTYMCLYSRALSEKSRELAVFDPFQYEVWICIIISTLVIGPILKVQSKVLEKITSQKSNWNLQTCSFNMFRNLVLQGNLLTITSWSQRFIFFSWYIFCLIVYVLYSGSLTSSFAVPAYEKPIDSLEDLPRAVKNGFTITVVGDTTNEYMFKEATGGIFKQTWDLFNHKDRSKSFVESSEQGMRLVLEGKTVHITTEENGKLLAAQMGRHDFYLGRGSFFPNYAAFPLPQGSPYRKAFNKIIRMMIESGLIHKWDADEIDKMPKNVGGEHESRTLVITLAHLQAAFLLLFLGYSMASMVILTETFVWTLFST